MHGLIGVSMHAILKSFFELIIQSVVASSFDFRSPFARRLAHLPLLAMIASLLPPLVKTRLDRAFDALEEQHRPRPSDRAPKDARSRPHSRQQRASCPTIQI